MANEAHLAILKQGVAVWNQWRKDNPEVKADLSQIDLSYASLNYTDLRFANLHAVDLSFADLSFANLSFTNSSHAVLRHTEIIGADLSNVDFSHAVLRHAVLFYANISDAVLRHTDLADASIGRTIFGNVDMSEAKGLETIRHQGPSTIGIDTIYLSKGNIPYKFLSDAGVPKDDIGYLLSLAGKAIDFYSCFISYSSQDQAFADRLHADLQAKGVRCWYAPEDLTIGEPLLLGIDKGIRLHDRLLLVLSEHSMASNWVQHEVLSALQKEKGQKPLVLFPVRLDDTVLHTDVPWANMIKPRHIGDFTQWKDHDAYQKAFDRLLRDLKMNMEI